MAVKELISSGNLSDVYEYDSKHVIKLYRIKDIEKIVSYYNKAVLLNDISLPIPKVVTMLEEDGKQGIIFKKAKGENLLDITLENGNTKYCGTKLAIFHKKIHSVTNCNLPSYKEELLKKIDESNAKDEYKARARTILEILPEGNNLCHGDFHPGNMVSNKGRMSIIDWDNACIGPKEFDVAMTFTILNTNCFVEKGLRSRNIREVSEKIIKTYLKEMGLTLADIDQYLYVCFVAHYSKFIDEKTEKNINNYLDYVR